MGRSNNIEPFEKFSHKRRKPEQRDPPEYSTWAELSRAMFSQIQVGKYPEAMQLDAKKTRLNLYLLLSAEHVNIIHIVLVLQVYRMQKWEGHWGLYQALRKPMSSATCDPLCRDSEQILHVATRVKLKLPWRPRILKMPSMQNILWAELQVLTRDGPRERQPLLLVTELKEWGHPSLPDPGAILNPKCQQETWGSSLYLAGFWSCFSDIFAVLHSLHFEIGILALSPCILEAPDLFCFALISEGLTVERLKSWSSEDAMNWSRVRPIKVQRILYS